MYSVLRGGSARADNPTSEIIRDSTLIIDGLDECSPNKVQKLVAIIKNLLAASSCRIFFASREDIDMTRMISSSVRIRITPTNTKADIELFIERVT
jgi:hypothetical protein